MTAGEEPAVSEGAAQDIIESHEGGEPLAVDLGQRAERTVAVIADPEASPLFLGETVVSLCEGADVAVVVVDLHGAPGVAVARALVERGIAFERLVLGQEDRVPEALRAERDEVAAMARGENEQDMEELALIDANLVLVADSVTEQGVDLMSFGLDALPGIVLRQAEVAGRAAIVVVPPEMGLVRERAEDGDEYLRKLVHIAPE